MAENVLDEIRQWTRDNFTSTNKIQQIYLQKGGWEGWAQVELALHFTAIGGWNCQREVQVYHDSQKRADLLLTAEGGPPNTTIIELKTEALWRDAHGVNQFVESMKEDLYKIDHNRIDKKYLPARLVVFGCTFIPAVSQYAETLNHWGEWAPYITGMKLLGSPDDFVGLYSWSLDTEISADGKIEGSTSRVHHRGMEVEGQTLSSQLS
ncbi:unnamed protein product [Alternaria alternata]